jgi:hypothetical protein
MGAKGVFLLKEPFVALASRSYTVIASRSFEELVARGNDPLSLVYAPVGLTNVEYQADIALGAQVIALKALDQDVMYVPDTYILSYPDMGVVPYSWTIASVSLGMLPDTYDTALLEEKVAAAVSDYIGVEPIVSIGRAAASDMITNEQHIQLTIARQAAIKSRDTDRQTALNAQATIATLQERVTLLETYIREKEL